MQTAHTLAGHADHVNARAAHGAARAAEDEAARREEIWQIALPNILSSIANPSYDDLVGGLHCAVQALDGAKLTGAYHLNDDALGRVTRQLIRAHITSARMDEAEKTLLDIEDEAKGQGCFMAEINTDSVRDIAAKLDSARKTLYVLKEEAGRLNLGHQAGISLSVNGRRIDLTEMDRGYMMVQIRGTEMIMLGVKKWYAARIGHAEDRVREFEASMVKAVQS